jgi:hypothetical protein
MREKVVQKLSAEKIDSGVEVACGCRRRWHWWRREGLEVVCGGDLSLFVSLFVLFLVILFVEVEYGITTCFHEWFV